jgi:hypothetical protein
VVFAIMRGERGKRVDGWDMRVYTERPRISEFYNV